MLKTKVKASGIHHLTDARYFASLGATWLGFDAGSPDNYREKAMLVGAIKEWVDGVLIIGEFDVQPLPILLEWIQLAGLDGVQVPEHRVEDIVPFLPQDVTILIDFSQNPDNQKMELWSSKSEAFILQPHQVNPDFNCIYEWRHSPQELDFFLKRHQPYGISITGGKEEKPGVKSFDELDDLLEALTF
jgi:phosphoribosylanthranilate isomerase